MHQSKACLDSSRNMVRLLAPAGTPKETIQALQRQAVIKSFEAQGLEILGGPPTSSGNS